MTTPSRPTRRPLREDARILRRAMGTLRRMSGTKRLWIKAVAGVFGVLFPFVNIYMSARIIDELTGARDVGRLALLVAVTIALNCAVALLQRALKSLCELYSRNLWTKYDMYFSGKIMHMDYEDVEDARTHELRAKIDQLRDWNNKGVNVVYDNLEWVVASAVRVAVSACMTASLFARGIPQAVGAYAVIDSPWVGVGLIALIAASIAASARLAEAAQHVWNGASEGMMRSNRVCDFFGFDLANDRQAAKDVRLYGQADAARRAMEGDEVVGDFIRDMSRGPARFHTLRAALLPMVTFAVYLYVVAKALGGAFGAGSIVQYVGAISQFAAGCIELTGYLGALRGNNEFIGATFDFLDIPERKYRGSIPVEKRLDNEYEIEFRDVSFRYPGARDYALRHVSLRFPIGKRFAIVGRNGSGKTTLVKLLCRLYDPTEGEILLNGVDIRKYDYDEYMGIFAVVFQDFHLFAFTLGQNVAASVDVDEARARASLEAAGVGDRWSLDTQLYKDFDDRGVEVSGGEAQRIAIARALYKDAPFIVLDEPTAALDPIAEAEVYARFGRIVADRTAVYISHRLSSCRFCDDILVFDGGELVQRGSHEGLVEAEGMYRELWRAQARYYGREGEEA